MLPCVLPPELVGSSWFIDRDFPCTHGLHHYHYHNHYRHHCHCHYHYTLHATRYNNGLVPGGQNLSRRQTVFFLPVDPRDESHRDPEYIDFSVPRLARYMHSAWKRHQDAVFWVDIDLAIKEGLTLYQTRSNAIILQGTLPAHCILKLKD